MANHKSAKKRAKQAIGKRATNRWKTSRVKTEVKKLREFIASSDKTAALKQLPLVQGLLARLSKSSAMKKATSSRKTSRLAAQVSNLK